MSSAWREMIERVKRMHPAKAAALGYAWYVAAGWIVLCLPICQRAVTSSLDNLFTAMSAVSTTGLVTVSVSDNYSILGQIVVLLLIQLGGIGYMTFGSFVLLSRHRELPTQRSDVGHTVFSLPESFRLEKFIRSVIAFTLVIELLGTIALYPVFAAADAPTPLWSAIFHSVSSFCTAGFSLYNSSLEAYASSFWLNVIVSALSFLGAIGFIVCVDFWRMVRGKVDQITLTSRIILWTSIALLLGGSFLLYITEPTIQSLSPDQRLLAAFFQAMTAMTTVGFNSISIGAMSKASLLVLITLMIIGASPAGTGGGIKSTTLSALLGVMKSALHGKREVRFWGKTIPDARVWTAMASLGYYLTLLLIGTYLLELVEPSNFAANLFEAASALGTVGLSMGITAGLTALGKLTLVILMMAGRLGPLTFAMALFLRRPSIRDTDNDLAI